MKADEKQQILEHNELSAKLQTVSNGLTREIALLEMKSKIESAAQQEMTDAQRQYYLREQLKASRAELGEGEKTDIQDLRKRLAAPGCRSRSRPSPAASSSGWSG
jgi:ATP-dependent Lon protease